MFVLFPPTVASGLTVNARLADVLVVLLLSGWQRTEQLGCITLNGGLLHIVLPLGPYGADGRVGQSLLPYLVLRRKTVFVVFPLVFFLPQAQLLKELEHRVTQEALHWQQLDFLKTCRMEKLLEDVGQKEQQLQRITEEADRASKLSQLQRKEIQREVRQVTPERRSSHSKSQSGSTSHSCFFLPVLSRPLMSSMAVLPCLCHF